MASAINWPISASFALIVPTWAIFSIYQRKLKLS
jgi:hypothetical protein